jgi:hypothetical protein
VSSITKKWVVKFGISFSVLKVKGTHCKGGKDVEELAKEYEERKS